MARKTVFVGLGTDGKITIIGADGERVTLSLADAEFVADELDAARNRAEGWGFDVRDFDCNPATHSDRPVNVEIRSPPPVPKFRVLSNNDNDISYGDRNADLPPSPSPDTLPSVPSY